MTTVVLKWPNKSPTDTATFVSSEYGLDWSAFTSTETIVNSLWNCSPSFDASSATKNLINVFSDIIQSGKHTRIFLGGGTANKSYKLTNTVTLSGGSALSRDVYISVK